MTDQGTSTSERRVAEAGYADTGFPVDAVGHLRRDSVRLRPETREEPQ